MRYHLRALVVIAVVVAACGGGSDPGAATDPADGSRDPEAAVFLDLTPEAAIELAAEQGRPWRIGREDDENYPSDAQLIVGRITFEVDNGKVTSASIERDTSPPPGNDVVEDPARANLIANAMKRLLTVDNTFGGGDVFEDIRIGSAIGTEPAEALQNLDLELIAAALSELGTVSFIDDADAEIKALFEASPEGVAVSPDAVAVASVQRIIIVDDRAELEMRLWCGSLCGTFLTYEAVLQDGEWEILGTTGPIAVS